MALVDDEALVVLAKECEYGPARDEILLRYSPQTERLIQWLARTTEFGNADVEDARQNAVFWTVEAINKFDTDQSDRDRRCSFYSFLYRVLVARFKDFNKQIRRLDRRQKLTSTDADSEDPLARLFRDPTNPALIAETAEAVHRLAASGGRFGRGRPGDLASTLRRQQPSRDCCGPWDFVRRGEASSTQAHCDIEVAPSRQFPGNVPARRQRPGADAAAEGGIDKDAKNSAPGGNGCRITM